MKKRGSRKRHPGTWVPKTSLCTRVKEDLLCNCVETIMLLANGSMENFSRNKLQKRQLGNFQRILHSWWKRRVAAPISDIGKLGKLVYREDKQEADHWANIGAQGRSKIDVYRKDDPTTWKAIRGFWMEASKTVTKAAAESWSKE